MKFLKVIGILFIIFGIVDFVGNFAGYDLWEEYIRVELPDLLWNFHAYIEIGIGVVLYILGSLGKKS